MPAQYTQLDRPKSIHRRIFDVVQFFLLVTLSITLLFLHWFHDFPQESELPSYLWRGSIIVGPASMTLAPLYDRGWPDCQACETRSRGRAIGFLNLCGLLSILVYVCGTTTADEHDFLYFITAFVFVWRVWSYSSARVLHIMTAVCIVILTFTQLTLGVIGYIPEDTTLSGPMWCLCVFGEPVLVLLSFILTWWKTLGQVVEHGRFDVVAVLSIIASVALGVIFIRGNREVQMPDRVYYSTVAIFVLRIFFMCYEIAHASKLTWKGRLRALTCSALLKWFRDSARETFQHGVSLACRILCWLQPVGILSGLIPDAVTALPGRMWCYFMISEPLFMICDVTLRLRWGYRRTVLSYSFIFTSCFAAVTCVSTIISLVIVGLTLHGSDVEAGWVVWVVIGWIGARLVLYLTELSNLCKTIARPVPDASMLVDSYPGPVIN